MSMRSRQVVLAIGFAGLLIESIASHPALAVDKVVLFKVTTPQSDIIIGLTREELDAMPGKDAEAVIGALHDKGTLSVWEYASRRGRSGDVEQAPSKKIELNEKDAVRVERFRGKSRVVAITEESAADVVFTGAL